MSGKVADAAMKFYVNSQMDLQLLNDIYGDKKKNAKEDTGQKIDSNQQEEKQPKESEKCQTLTQNISIFGFKVACLFLFTRPQRKINSKNNRNVQKWKQVLEFLRSFQSFIYHWITAVVIVALFGICISSSINSSKFHSFLAKCGQLNGVYKEEFQKCYFVHDPVKWYYEAKVHCDMNNTVLAYPESVEELKSLKGMRLGNTNCFHVGYHRSGQLLVSADGKRQIDTSSPLWAKGQPDMRDAHHLVCARLDESGLFMSGDHRRPFICAFKP